jgi:hypothetical protein
MAPMAKEKSLPLSARLARWRIWVQGAFTLVWLDPLALRMHTVCSPVFHCYSCPLALFACPIGVLANFSALHLFPFVALGMLAVIGALVGSFRLRLGLSLRFSSGSGGPGADAQIRIA